MEKLGVSRIPIREGMQRLEMLGILKRRSGQGTFLKNVIASKLMLSLASFDDNLKNDTLLELMELRKILEVGIVEISVNRKTNDDIKALKKCLTQHEIDVKQHDHLSDQYAFFHQLLALSTHNEVIIDFYNGVFQLIKNSLVATGKSRKNRMIGLNAYKQIFKAIAEQDSEKAIRAVNKHIDWLKNVISEEAGSLSSYHHILKGK